MVGVGDGEGEGVGELLGDDVGDGEGEMEAVGVAAMIMGALWPDPKLPLPLDAEVFDATKRGDGARADGILGLDSGFGVEREIMGAVIASASVAKGETEGETETDG